MYGNQRRDDVVHNHSIEAPLISASDEGQSLEWFDLVFIMAMPASSIYTGFLIYPLRYINAGLPQ